ncbi:MAG: helix-turn-helix domain-containing protein [Candidatus Babeliales bacterium]
MNPIIPQTNTASQQKLSQIVECLQHLSKSHQRIWRELNSYKNHYEFVFPSHDRLAVACNVHRNTVKNAINEFKRLGWIKTIRRYNKSLVYLFSSDFDCKDVQKAMSVFFITLALITPVLLQSPKRATNRDCPLSNIKSFIYKTNLRISESNTVGAREENVLAVILELRPGISIQKKENVMNEQANPRVAWGHAIKDLHQKLPLENHGLAKLSAFPAEAIRHASKFIPQIYKATTPFQYLVFLCDKYCSENAIQPDWAQYKALCSRFNIQEGNKEFLDMTAFEKLKADEEEKSEYQLTTTQNQYLKRDMRQQTVQSKPYTPPSTGPLAIWKQTDVRDEKFTVMGKLAYLDGDPTAAEWQKTKRYDEYAAILREGFSNQ